MARVQRGCSRIAWLEYRLISACWGTSEGFQECLGRNGACAEILNSLHLAADVDPRDPGLDAEPRPGLLA